VEFEGRHPMEHGIGLILRRYWEGIAGAIKIGDS
jgi:hypothetical protein